MKKGEKMGLRSGMSAIAGLGLSIMFLALAFNSNAQAGWNWPANDELARQARQNYIVANDYRKDGEFQNAKPYIDWLLAKTPELNKSLYLNAMSIYENLIEKATGDKRLILADSIMIIYDMRMKYFGEEEMLQDRKALDAYKYFRENADRYEWLIGQFEKSIELNREQIHEGNLLAYMDILRRGKKSDLGLVDDDLLLEAHEKISALLDKKLETAEDSEKIEDIRKQTDAMLVEVVDIDCDFISNNLAPKLAADASDLKVAKKIVFFSLQNKCINTEHFKNAVLTVYNAEPDFGIARLLGNLSKQERNWELAAKYYSEAAGMADSRIKKAETLIELGDLEARRGRKSRARDLFLQAVDTDPKRKDAYSYIGNLYFNSFNECAGLQDEVKDRAIYIAAYEMFKKAGNRRMMDTMREQFPSMQEMFLKGYKEGDSITVGCWINETVSLQKRNN